MIVLFALSACTTSFVSECGQIMLVFAFSIMMRPLLVPIVV